MILTVVLNVENYKDFFKAPNNLAFNSQTGVQKSNPQAGGSPFLATSGKRPPRFPKLTPPIRQVLKTIILFLNRKKF